MKVNRQVWNLCRIIFHAKISELERQYEVLTNLVLSYGGRIHGSQHTVNADVDNTIAVYFEVPKDSLDEFLKEEENYF